MDIQAANKHICETCTLFVISNPSCKVRLPHGKVAKSLEKDRTRSFYMKFLETRILLSMYSYLNFSKTTNNAINMAAGRS